MSEDQEDRQLTPLELEFKATIEKHQAKIEEQITIARKAIAKAEKIAEKYGIPFSSDITPLTMSYQPASFVEKWGEIEDENFLYDLIGDYYPEEEGWEHSAVC